MSNTIVRVKHGHALDGMPSPTYSAWVSMKTNCSCKTAPAYKSIGAKGIKVCARWMTFEPFLEDMGERPEGTLLVRKDKTKDFEPDNCEWRPKPPPVTITFQGETHTYQHWADRIGITRRGLATRIARGWPLERCLTEGKRYSP